MSINDLTDDIEAIARRAAFEAKAIYVCPFHDDVILSNFDEDANNHAYAIATSELKRSDKMFMREDVMAAVQNEIVMADDECNICQSIADS